MPEEVDHEGFAGLKIGCEVCDVGNFIFPLAFAAVAIVGESKKPSNLIPIKPKP